MLNYSFTYSSISLVKCGSIKPNQCLSVCTLNIDISIFYSRLHKNLTIPTENRKYLFKNTIIKKKIQLHNIKKIQKCCKSYSSNKFELLPKLEAPVASIHVYFSNLVIVGWFISRLVLP